MSESEGLYLIPIDPLFIALLGIPLFYYAVSFHITCLDY